MRKIGLSVTARPAVATAATTTTAVAILRFVDAQRAARKVLTVQRLHRARRVRIGHLDEAKATGTARLAVRDERELLHRAVRSEERADRFLGRVKGKISDVKLGH